jgi:hypothetical protein
MLSENSASPECNPAPCATLNLPLGSFQLHPNGNPIRWYDLSGRCDTGWSGGSGCLTKAGETSIGPNGRKVPEWGRAAPCGHAALAGAEDRACAHTLQRIPVGLCLLAERRAVFTCG